jgi:hypothetical protein
MNRAWAIESWPESKDSDGRSSVSACANVAGMVALFAQVLGIRGEELRTSLINTADPMRLATEIQNTEIIQPPGSYSLRFRPQLPCRKEGYSSGSWPSVGEVALHARTRDSGDAPSGLSAW